MLLVARFSLKRHCACALNMSELVADVRAHDQEYGDVQHTWAGVH